MGAVLADTHAIIWYLAQPNRLSALARAALTATHQSGDPIYLASISHVEVRYLTEKWRLPIEALRRLDSALSDADSILKMVPLDRNIVLVLGNIARDEVPDMPDRIIAATALYLNVPLVTHDGRIRATAITTIW